MLFAGVANTKVLREQETVYIGFNRSDSVVIFNT